jgi:ribosomal protein L32
MLNHFFKGKLTMGKACLVCGEPISERYEVCKTHYVLINNGTIIQCSKCGKWHLANEICECEQSKNTHFNKFDDERIQVDINAILNPQVKDYRKKNPSIYHCADGHYVRLKSEVAIDDYFYEHNIMHAYEPLYLAMNGGEYYPDFYVPHLKLYLEYFGKDNEFYLGKAEKKINLYAQDTAFNFDYLMYEHDRILKDELARKLKKWEQKLNTK